MAFYPKYDYEVPELAKEVITGEAHTIPAVGDPVITLRHIPRQAGLSALVDAVSDVQALLAIDRPPDIIPFVCLTGCFDIEVALKGLVPSCPKNGKTSVCG